MSINAENNTFVKKGVDHLNSGRITLLLRYPQRKTPPAEESELILTEGHGIEGDCHADGGERQISILTVEEKEWMEKQEVKGFCFKKYKENILFDGISLKNCRAGDRIICGEAELELTCSLKGCHPDLCKIASEGGKCILAGSTRFAQVKRGGTIRNGMEVRVEKKA